MERNFLFIALFSFAALIACSNGSSSTDMEIKSHDVDTLLPLSNDLDSIQEYEDVAPLESCKLDKNAICELWWHNLGTGTPLPNEILFYDIDGDGISEIILRDYDEDEREVFAVGILSNKNQELRWLDGICDDCGGRQSISITDGGFIETTIEASISSNTYYKKIKNSEVEVSYMYNIEYDRWSDVDDESLEEPLDESDYVRYERERDGITIEITEIEFKVAIDSVGSPLELNYDNDSLDWKEFSNE